MNNYEKINVVITTMSAKVVLLVHSSQFKVHKLEKTAGFLTYIKKSWPRILRSQL